MVESILPRSAGHLTASCVEQSRRLVDVLYNTVTEVDTISPRRPGRTS